MIVTAGTYHVPVLLTESVDGLNIGGEGSRGGVSVYVDATFGGGGHSREILRRLTTGGHLYSFDQDADAEPTAPLLPDTEAQGGSFIFVRSNFRYLKQWLRYYGVWGHGNEDEGLDGILADLGVSSHHFDEAERGFSFRYDAPLDMRMNQREGTTAADLVASYTEEHLADVFYLYGELRNARRLAAAVVKARSQRPIRTTADLASCAESIIGHKNLPQLFQALRIEVNHEMDALRELLAAATEVLKPGGRLAVITYHSLEDRIVKNVMKTGNAAGVADQDFYGRVQSPYRLITSKPITPSSAELQANPRSRSAKLRIAERR